MDNIMNHYQAVLADLEFRRNRCQTELTELERTITGLKSTMATTARMFMSVSATGTVVDPVVVQSDRRYAGMGVRWSVLNLLCEFGPGPLKTTEIAEKLVEGGATTKGKDFVANVSAVISNMVKERKELESDGAGAYRLTESGRLAWAAIKHSPRYVNRASSATLQ